mmetsp:Transcript_8347/g.26578  ORF Transcript_8347/g.26578 Transcript_8347/m.26578 type:complete len:419 (-) Transcript_8347:14-1270(-)
MPPATQNCVKLVAHRQSQPDSPATPITASRHGKIICHPDSQLTVCSSRPPTRLPSEGVVGLRREGAAAALDDHRCRVGARLAAVRHGQALHEAGEEAAHVGVAGAVRVHELLLRELQNGVLRDDALHAHDGVVAALRDHHGAGPRLHGGHEREPRGDELDVLRLPALRLGPGERLSLVAEEEVHVRHPVEKAVLEGRHLHEEGRREVHAVDAAVLLLLHRSELDGLLRHRHEEAGAVDDLRLLHELPVLGLLAMLGLVVVRGAQVCAQRALDAHDERGAGARGHGLVDHVVRRHAIRLAGLRQGLAVCVLAHAAHVGRGARLLQHPLRDADAVLRGAAGDVLHVGHLHHLVEEGLVLLLREDRVSALEPVLVEQLLAHLRGDVQQRVAHAEESHLEGRRGELGGPCKVQGRTKKIKGA